MNKETKRFIKKVRALTKSKHLFLLGEETAKHLFSVEKFNENDWNLPYKDTTVIIHFEHSRMAVRLYKEIDDSLLTMVLYYPDNVKVIVDVYMDKLEGNLNNANFSIRNPISTPKGPWILRDKTKEEKEYLRNVHSVSHLILAYFDRFASSTRYFVVKSTHYKGKANKKSKKKLGLATYRMLHVNTIRKHYIRRDDVTGNSRSRPVERRGHWRRFKHTRFVNMQGKKVWVKSTWVGSVKSTDKTKCVIHEVLPNLDKEVHDAVLDRAV
jgi:hypothetical protein